MSTPTLIIACVFVAAVLITLVAMFGLASGVGAYHRAVIATSQSHLSDAFIAVGRHQIIAMTIGGTLGLSVLGYLALGVPGVILGSFAGLVARLGGLLGEVSHLVGGGGDLLDGRRQRVHLVGDVLQLLVLALGAVGDLLDGLADLLACTLNFLTGSGDLFAGGV